MQLNNLLQTTRGAQALTWEAYQVGPQHTAPWTAIAYSKRGLIFQATADLNMLQSKVSNGAAASITTSPGLRRLLPGRHIALSTKRPTARNLRIVKLVFCEALVFPHVDFKLTKCCSHDARPRRIRMISTRRCAITHFSFSMTYQYPLLRYYYTPLLYYD